MNGQGMQQTTVAGYTDAPTNGDAERRLITVEKMIDKQGEIIRELENRLRPICTPAAPAIGESSDQSKEGPPVSPVANRLRNLESQIGFQGDVLTSILHRLEF